MGIAIRNVNALVPHPLSDGDGAVAHVDQQGDVGMAQIMDTDALDPGGSSAALLAMIRNCIY